MDDALTLNVQWVVDVNMDPGEDFWTHPWWKGGVETKQ